MNGHDRFTARDFRYFSRTQVWQHHSGAGGLKGDTAGAGGFGDPLERSDTDLIEDKNSGKFSEDFLTKEYPQWENLSNLKK